MSKRMSNKQRDNSTQKYAGIGFQLVFLTLIFVLSGKYLDAYLNLESVFLLIGIFIAVFAVMYILINRLK